MNEPKNIEELFKSAFDNFESDPGISWQAMQGKIAQNAAGSGSAAATSVISGKLILIAASVLIVTGLAITYAIWTPEQKNETENKKAEKTVVLSSEIKPEETVVPEDKQFITEENSVIVEHKDISNKTSKIKITIREKEPKQNMNESVVNRWMTPREQKDKIMAAYHNKEKNNKGTSNDTYIEPVRFNNIEVQVENVTENKPAASIVASLSGGPAPLQVDFSNQLEGEYSYEWNFGDNKLSEESAPGHVFEEAGSYTVTLTIKDKKGNKSSDKITIEVSAAEQPSKEGSWIKNINVFSPNGDNVNDYFMLESENIKEFYIHILNLNGDLLFESNDVNFKWDGKDKRGNSLPAGQYLYRYNATGADGKKHSEKPVILNIKY